MSEALKAVRNINDYLFVASEHLDYQPFLKHVESPVGDYIEFMDCIIWDSENDGRSWDISIDDYEPLGPYLVKEIATILESLENTVNTVKQIKWT
jgi:hypothetical protein